MSEFFAALFAVAAAELGDKTQFLALLLAARYPKQRMALIAGMMLGMILMHGVASVLGYYLGDFLAVDWLSYVVGALFILMGLAILRPEREEKVDSNSKFLHLGAFFAALLLLSVSEIADKSQIVTMMLAAHYQSIFPVAAGAVVGMNLILIPVIFFGAWITNRVPMKMVRIFGCVVFVSLGLLAIFNT
ncbi:hypothetical protein CWE08_09525 [Aliidiomarina iranensis]|uniref:GDT1 family protein n=1 Tax=Aliidiomarina iranensis TaxID=1434071 RepID=A0A432VTF0_9GAMM|nr:TMEM165/GDT1 family protein [Aliidiomarina iranensis]RUO19660.1 hypothetical protein CWE08_09525 [Aliidiomarina iranensis]